MLFCSTILRITFQHMMIDEDDKNVSVFAIEAQSESEFTCDQSVLQTKVDVCSYFLCLILPLLKVYRNANDCASRVAVRFLACIIFRKRKLECDYSCVIVYTHFCTCLWFKNCTLFFYWEQKRYGLFTSELVGLFVYCVNLCHICSIIAWDKSAVQLYLTVLTSINCYELFQFL